MLDLQRLSNLGLYRRGVVQVVEELDKILAFNNKLISLKNHPEAASLARGVGPVSLVGKDADGAFDFLT